MHPPQEVRNNEIDEMGEDWEEWDGKGPFWVHCVAGSIAGVAEHTLVYPLDTLRTHIQVCASCIHRTATGAFVKPTSGATVQPAGNQVASSIRGIRGTAAASAQQLPTGMYQTMRFLMNEPLAAAAAMPQETMLAPKIAPVQSNFFRMTRLWRGVESIVLGCIPAHALYFSVYETLKAASPRNQNGEVVTWAMSLTGAAATISHDVVMTPLDTVKQRMQLGHYSSTSAALKEIIQTETWAALYRSFPITLATNIPYGMVFMPINDHCKAYYAKLYPDRPSYVSVLLASSTAGFVASAVTTPLDRIKTALQTQTLKPACLVNPQELCAQSMKPKVFHADWQQAAKYIWKTEGCKGFWRGLSPRVISHTPALAISWTTYETAKQALMKHYS